MPLYQRYIFNNLTAPLLIIIISVTGLIWLMRILSLIDLIEIGAAAKNLCSIIVLIIPSLLFVTLPIVTTISTIYAYNKLDQDKQLIALKNAGLSNFKIAKPGIILASIVMSINFFISYKLMPLSYHAFQNKFYTIKSQQLIKSIKTNSFNKLSNGITLFITTKTDNNELEKIVLFDEKMPDKVITLFAQNGRLLSDDRKIFLELFKGIRHSYDINNNITSIKFDNLIINISEASIDRSNSKHVNETSIEDLIKPSDKLNQNRRTKLIAQGHQRILWPIYSLLLPTLSLSIFLKLPYNRRSSINKMLISLLASMISVFIYFICIHKASYHSIYLYISYSIVIASVILNIIFYSYKKLPKEYFKQLH